MTDSRLFNQRVSVHETAFNSLSQQAIDEILNASAFFLCLQGTMRILYEHQEHQMQQGDVFIQVPTTPVRLLQQSTDLRVLHIRSTLELSLPYLERSVNPANLIAIHKQPITHLDEGQMERVQQLRAIIADRQAAIDKLQRGGVETPILTQQILRLEEAFFFEMLHDYFSNNISTLFPPHGKARIFQQFIVSLIRNHHHEREVGFYANELGLTPRYFSTLVKGISGRTASSWIIQMVIDSICHTLLYTDKTLKQIAEEYNFPTQSFFGKYFKQYTGTSPRIYRLRGGLPAKKSN